MNGRKIDIGSVFGTYTVTGTEIDKKNKTNYILECTCGNIVKKIGHEVRKAKKCQKCGIQKILGTKHYKTLFLEYIGKSNFHCLCDCGKKFTARARARSCGCHLLEEDIKNSKQLEGLSNKNIKLLKFLYFKKKPNGANQAIYKAKCKCGNIFEIPRSYFGRIKSCGCRKFSSHSKGQEQGAAIYSDSQIKTAIDLYLSGQYSKQEICSMLEIKLSTLQDVISNKSWKHIEVDKNVLDTSPLKTSFRKKRKNSVILPNQQFNSWTTLEKAPSKHRRAYWLCRCKCGNEFEVPQSSLVRGESKQCAKCSLISFIKREYLL